MEGMEGGVSPIASVRMWIALVVSLLSWPCSCWLPIQAEAVAVHYAENVIGCSCCSGSKQLRLMLNRDSSSSNRRSSSRKSCHRSRLWHWRRGKLNGRSFPSVLLWQEIDAPSSDATGFVCASTRTSCRVINARQSQHKRQPDKALPLPRCPLTPLSCSHPYSPYESAIIGWLAYNYTCH